MKIVVDENIPYGRQAFGRLGDVCYVHGRAIAPETVRDAELLIVRSITPVDADLLEGSRVRFVATATAGGDHIDRDYLQQAGIAFADAPGANANSVAEYVAAALLLLSRKHHFALQGKKIAIIGVGHVGSLVENKCAALGLIPLLNDPPLARLTRDPKYRPLEEILPQAEIVTLHAPLNRGGADNTLGLVDAAFLKRLKPGAILINSARGKIHKDAALIESLESGKLAAGVFDVWETEPDVNPALLAAAEIATPHIAGYAYDAKLNGTQLVFDAACRFLGVSDAWKIVDPIGVVKYAEVDCRGKRPEEALLEAVRVCYDLKHDDQHMRVAMACAAEARPAHFDRLRKEYPVRREFQNTTIALLNGSAELQEQVAGLGFQIA